MFKVEVLIVFYPRFFMFVWGNYKTKEATINIIVASNVLYAVKEIYNVNVPDDTVVISTAEPKTCTSNISSFGISILWYFLIEDNTNSSNDSFVVTFIIVNVLIVYQYRIISINPVINIT